jgi:lysyl-tRNA synthetase class 2
MKRLLAAGAKAIYQVTRAFRGGESGRHHNPEFTIVEWYRVGDAMDGAIQLLSELCDTLLNRGAAERTTYGQTFHEHLGLDPHSATVVELAAAAAAHDVCVPPGMPDNDRDSWLNLLLAACVEPHLGRGAPTILYDYPASQAALARVVTRGPHAVAERFELYVDGLELANGYHELLDAAILRQRSSQANRQRIADGKHALPEGTRLEAAMRHGLPPCAGVALGFDRVVMLATGADSLADVLAFPIDRA